MLGLWHCTERVFTGNNGKRFLCSVGRVQTVFPFNSFLHTSIEMLALEAQGWHLEEQPLIPTCHYNQVQKNVTEIMFGELGLSTVLGDELPAHLHCEY